MIAETGKDYEPVGDGTTMSFYYIAATETTEKAIDLAGELKRVEEFGCHIVTQAEAEYPELLKLVNHLSDDQIRKLLRGGHDTRKMYAAYKAATEHKGQPTVILAKTVKGWTLGPGVEARNITHQAKKLSEVELRTFRDRLQLPIPDAALKDAPYYHPGPDSEEVRYMQARRAALRTSPGH